ncbi:hypothetical protein EPN18_04170 [bacterium]|nr:MAG: hypothetical protein EPN18_04170 [bacterium]
MTKKAFFVAVMIVAFSISASAAVKRQQGSELIKKEKGLEDVKKKLREEKTNVKKIAAKEVSVLGELERVNISLSNKRSELLTIEAGLDRTKRDALSVTVNISRLEREKKALLSRLKQRMRAMYKMRGYSNANAFLPAWESDAALNGRRQKYMAIIMNSDAALMEQARVAMASLDLERERLGGLKSSMEASRDAALVKKAEAEALQKEKAGILSEVKKEKAISLKLITELDAAAAEMAELIKKLRGHDSAPSSAKGFGAMRGRLRPPVEGRIISSYGKVRHPKFQTVTFNNGIVIEARQGSVVRSVYDGTVVYTGWLKGYGQLVILDNGDGFYTLFAHLQKALKERGQEVKKGEDVGLAGDTGADGVAGLYFEIREKGIPRDPAPWFASVR